MLPSSNHHSVPVSLDNSGLETQLAWERDARRSAEESLARSKEGLDVASKNLEEVFSASVKMLTDVLAMARPELFQKAAKIQRWARKIESNLNVQRPWELDLAAILYPLGAISLPDDLAMKYALCEPLDEEERKEVDACARTAYDLICNIPRMQGVAEAVLYCRKGYDGSGLPKNDIRGNKIPQNARILKVLIDLADFSTGAGVTRADGFMKMASRKQEYDLDVLKIAYIALLENESADAKKRTALTIGPALLRAGDVLLKDIVDKKNGLLLAAGSELSDHSIKRLQAMVAEGRVMGKVSVQRI